MSVTAVEGAGPIFIATGFGMLIVATLWMSRPARARGLKPQADVDALAHRTELISSPAPGMDTGVTVPIGLHVQADWLLVTSRREIMEVETNAWHREILTRLPGLLRSYLAWVAGLQDVPERRLSAAYTVLPDWSETDGTFLAYLQDPEFRESLRAALLSLRFLPVRTRDGIRFSAPEDSRLLPGSLRIFDEARLLPWVLFGEDVLSTGWARCSDACITGGP
jgi:hypothetical protein